MTSLLHAHGNRNNFSTDTKTSEKKKTVAIFPCEDISIAPGLEHATVVSNGVRLLERFVFGNYAFRKLSQSCLLKPAKSSVVKIISTGFPEKSCYHPHSKPDTEDEVFASIDFSHRVTLLQLFCVKIRDSIFTSHE